MICIAHPILCGW